MSFLLGITKVAVKHFLSNPNGKNELSPHYNLKFLVITK